MFKVMKLQIEIRMENSIGSCLTCSGVQTLMAIVKLSSSFHFTVTLKLSVCKEMPLGLHLPGKHEMWISKWQPMKNGANPLLSLRTYQRKRSLSNLHLLGFSDFQPNVLLFIARKIWVSSGCMLIHEGKGDLRDHHGLFHWSWTSMPIRVTL